jgi:hypothetical protein
VPLSAIRLGRAAETKMKQDAVKGRGAAADSSGARVKFSKSSEVFKQLVIAPLSLSLHQRHLRRFDRPVCPVTSSLLHVSSRSKTKRSLVLRQAAALTCPSSTRALQRPSLPVLTRCSKRFNAAQRGGAQVTAERVKGGKVGAVYKERQRQHQCTRCFIQLKDALVMSG